MTGTIMGFNLAQLKWLQPLSHLYSPPLHLKPLGLWHRAQLHWSLRQLWQISPSLGRDMQGSQA